MTLRLAATLAIGFAFMSIGCCGRLRDRWCGCDNHADRCASPPPAYAPSYAPPPPNQCQSQGYYIPNENPPPPPAAAGAPAYQR